MRRSGFLLLMVALLSGCATMTASRFTANNRMSLAHLSRGMSKAKALALMRSGVSVYTCDQVSSRKPVRVTINNPYSTEIIEPYGRVLEVIYYATGLNNNCLITDDELTPLVFEDNKLIGWGKNFLSGLLSADKVPIQAQVEQKPQAQQKELTPDSGQPEQGKPEPKQSDQTAREQAQKEAVENTAPLPAAEK
ncbi:MAG: DUF3192 domain-containing protein [Candidatus Omnitrophica bacterium]|nr:DUF3192 domain-containing protein [Candidatus Omnitrophota bacterium]